MIKVGGAYYKVDDILCFPDIREKSVLDCLYRIKEIEGHISKLRDKKVSFFDRKESKTISAALERFEDEKSLLINKCIEKLGGDVNKNWE